MPVATEMPNNISLVRPSIAWSGPQAGGPTTGLDRLWMVAEQGGVLRYRVRDAGTWSGWVALPSSVAPIPPMVGGAAVISNGTTLEVFARATDKKVYTTILTSPVSCTPDVGNPRSCGWAAWAAIPNSPTTDHDPAVAYKGTMFPHVIVRRNTDGALLRTLRYFGVWSSWVALTGLTTTTAPAIAWNSVENRFWIAAVDAASPTVIRAGRYSTDTGQVELPWEAAPAGASPWTPPAVAFDGARTRIFAGEGTTPNLAYQSIRGSSSWGAWRVVPGTRCVRQPAAANMNGDVNLMTVGYNNNILEQAQ